MPDMNAMGVPGAAPAPDASPMAPPAGAPSSPPSEGAGEKEQAKANVQMAIAMLEQNLPRLGSNTPEGAALIKALSLLSKTFGGQKSGDLVPAELMQVMASMPDQHKQQVMAEMGGGAQPAGIPGGPHVPANMNP